MKIIQRIVARKGTDVEALKAAVGEDAASVLDFSKPREAGAFSVYDQHPENAVKADTQEVVSLADDNSILCICGEPEEKSEGFSISKLLARKTQLKAVEVPANIESLPQDVLKSDMSDALWSECNALTDGLRGILAQKAGENGDKIKMVGILFDNFMATLKEVSAIMKSDEFDAPKQDTQPAQEPVQEQVTPEAAHETVEEKSVDTVKEEKTQESEKSVDEQPVEKSQAPSTEVAELRAMLESQNEKITALTDLVQKMQKAPAQVVSAHEDDGPKVPAAKSQDNIQNVFAGVFGDLRR